MDHSAQTLHDVQRINASLSLAIVEYQNHTARQGRQLETANQDNNSLKNHVASLEKMLMQQVQQHQAEMEKLRSQHQIQVEQLQRSSQQNTMATMAPTALFHALPSQLLQDSMAGTLITSPSKGIRRPVFDEERENKPQPLKLSDLPKRQPSKRAPLHSPPAKKAQSKRVDSRPTPQKIAPSVAANDDDDTVETMSFDALRKADWKVAATPNSGPSELLLTAIYRQSNGSVATLQSSLDWLVRNVPSCLSIRQQREPTASAAANIVANIESWLQHNIGSKRYGTLPTEMEHALQAVASAVLFNTKANVRETLRELPTFGRHRLNRMKNYNAQLISEDKRFVWLDRKLRKDSVWPLVCLFVRKKICWNDKYTKVDTNYSRKVKCLEPQIQAMKGGGHRLIGWRTIERERRMWYEETTLDDVLKLVKGSPEWAELVTEYPEVSLGRNALRLALCPSIRKPTFRSCVNEKMSALTYLMEDLYTVINNNEVLRRRIAECQCVRHSTARSMIALNCTPPPLWHQQLRCLPSRFCGLATCEKVPHPALKIPGKDPPTLRNIECTRSSCTECSLQKKLGLGDPDCTAFKDCTELMEVTLWKEVPRNGNRTQREPTRFTGADRKTVAEVHEILVKEVAPAALEHLGEAQWWHTQVDRKVATFGTDELLIYTDFSATPEFVAKEVGNCHEAEHCVIDVICVLDNPRTVVVVNKEGQAVQKRINDCTYWAVLGPTDGKGKKNDHRFHREALHSVVNYHKSKAESRSVEIKKVTMLTDNCGGQFKSQFNMGDTAWFAERHPGISMEHCYAPIFEFKGVHDGFGKIIKWKLKEAELKGIRIPDAKAAYEYILKNYAGWRAEWDALEREASQKLLQRGPFTMTEVRTGYVADTIAEVNAVKESIGGEHVLHCDRTTIPRTVGDKSAKGLTEIYSMRGKRKCIRDDAAGKKLWSLEVASRACFCSTCANRDSCEERCPYYKIRNAREIVVSDMSTDESWCEDSRAKTAVSTYFREEHKFKDYVNIARMKQELDRLKIQYADNASRRELSLIFLTIMRMRSEALDTQEELLLGIEEDSQNSPNPSVDDDYAEATENESQLPSSEEESPTDIDYHDLNDIDDEGAEVEKECTISDNELKTMTVFSVLSDSVLRSILAQRQLPTDGSREEQEERLEKAIRPF